jgi:hypothetical protein
MIIIFSLLLKCLTDFINIDIPLGKVILTTIYENKDLLHELFGALPTVSHFTSFLLLYS